MALDIHSDIWTILRKDRTDLLDEALQTGIVQPDRTDGNGRSLLFRAKSADALRILSAHGATFGHESNFRETALHHAANDEIVRLLLEGGADIDRLTSIRPYQSALATALRDGRYKAAQALLDNGARVNPSESDEYPPLNAVISGMSFGRSLSPQGHSEGMSLLRRLLEAGADPNVKFAPSPLMLAVRSNDINMVRLLFEYGARADYDTLHAAVGTGNDIILEELLRRTDREILETTSLSGIYTPLHAVMQRGDGEMLDALGICKGERTASLLVEAGMPLTGCLLYARGPRTARWILEKGADPNECGKHGHTAAHFAAELGNTEILKVLLEYGAEINRNTLDGDTALHCAVRNGHADCVRVLLDAGVKTNITNKFGETAEELASGTELEDMFRLENRYKKSLVMEFDDTRCIEYSDAAENLILRRIEQTQDGEKFISDFRSEFSIREREERYSPVRGINGIATIILMHPSKSEAVTLSPPEGDSENLQQIHAWLEQPFIPDAVMKEMIQDAETAYGPCP